jgi:hypothetical protein
MEELKEIHFIAQMCHQAFVYSMGNENIPKWSTLDKDQKDIFIDQAKMMFENWKNDESGHPIQN